MRLPATAAVFAATALVGVLATSACSSDGTPTPRTTASARLLTLPVNSATASTPSVTIAVPQPTSTAERRTPPLRKPAGARQLTFKECSSTVDDLVGIEQYMRIVLVGYPKSPQIATGNFKDIPPLMTKPLQTLEKLRGYWLAAGYPATFPTVRDVDAMTGWAHRLLTAARSSDIAALPDIYLPYNSALDQYLSDANDTLCAG